MMQSNAAIQEPPILVLGVGGGGSNIVQALAARNAPGIRFASINTDGYALQHLDVEATLQIGEGHTGGLGTGGNVELGKRAAEEDRERIQALFDLSPIVVVVSCLGGGTGTGAAPVIARLAGAQGALVLCVVTTPFSFEGRGRQQRAEAGLVSLQEASDSLVIFSGDFLLGTAAVNATLSELLQHVDATLGTAILDLCRGIQTRGCARFADLRIHRAEKRGIVGIGTAWGERRGIEAAHQAWSELVRQKAVLSDTESLLCVVSAEEAIESELSDIRHEAGKSLAVGQVPECIFLEDPSLGASIRVTLYALGCAQLAEKERDLA